jgi:hypothetical protein
VIYYLPIKLLNVLLLCLQNTKLLFFFFLYFKPRKCQMKGLKSRSDCIRFFRHKSKLETHFPTTTHPTISLALNWLWKRKYLFLFLIYLSDALFIVTDEEKIINFCFPPVRFLTNAEASSETTTLKQRSYLGIASLTLQCQVVLLLYLPIYDDLFFGWFFWRSCCYCETFFCFPFVVWVVGQQ